MPDVAAPPPGRRVSAGAVLVLLGFLLLAPPVFVLGPLAALLAASRPATWRERIWLAATVVLTAIGLAVPGDLAQQVVRAAGMGLAGGTLAVVVARRATNPFRLAVTATVAAACGTLLWGAILGTTFEAFRAAVEADLRRGYTALMALQADRGGSSEVQSFLASLADSAGMMAAYYPGVLLVLAVAGSMLAWLWLHRIAATPVGEAPGPFRAFRFNDHLIWGAIFTLAIVVLPTPPGLRLLGGNLLVGWIALYLARGLAVMVSMLAASPWLLKLGAAAFAVLLQPFSSGALLAMGLADTWIDFRRRPPPVPGGHAS